MAQSERRENDHYVTPDWAIRRFLESYSPPKADRILDPCAAKGELLTTAKNYFRSALLGACDINPAFRADLLPITDGAVVIGDFLQSVGVLNSCKFDFILTNPPYNKAEEFIKASLEVAPTVAMLLRINFLASQKRRDFLATTRPAIYVLPNRPSFTGAGGDMTEYAWFVFGDAAVAGQIDWLDLTPAEEIRASNERARLIHAEEPLLICRDCGADSRVCVCAVCGGEAGLSEGTATEAA
jgi:hypothetical protein